MRRLLAFSAVVLVGAAAVDKEGQSEGLTEAEVIVVVLSASRPPVVRGNTWFLRNSTTTGPADSAFQDGDSTDVALFGDWNGSGTDGPGVVRGNTWYLRNSNTSGVVDVSFRYGNRDDFPVAWGAVPG